MPLDRDELRRIAALARLELEPAEEARFASQLARVVDAFDALAGFEVAPVAAGEAPVIGPPAAGADRPEPGLPRERALAAATGVEGGFFVVPAVLPGGPGEERR